MDVPALILILCNPLDRSDCSFAKDVLQGGTHTALITACFVLELPVTSLTLVEMEGGPKKLHPSPLHLSSEPKAREERVAGKIETTFYY